MMPVHGELNAKSCGLLPVIKQLTPARHAAGSTAHDLHMLIDRMEMQCRFIMKPRFQIRFGNLIAMLHSHSAAESQAYYSISVLTAECKSNKRITVNGKRHHVLVNSDGRNDLTAVERQIGNRPHRSASDRHCQVIVVT